MFLPLYSRRRIVLAAQPTNPPACILPSASVSCTTPASDNASCTAFWRCGRLSLARPENSANPVVSNARPGQVNALGFSKALGARAGQSAARGAGFSTDPASSMAARRRRLRRNQSHTPVIASNGGIKPIRQTSTQPGMPKP